MRPPLRARVVDRAMPEEINLDQPVRIPLITYQWMDSGSELTIKLEGWDGLRLGVRDERRIKRVRVSGFIVDGVEVEP